MTPLKTHTIAFILQHIRGKGMAMTMKTVGLLLWASMNLDWADHVFKVGDPARNNLISYRCPSPKPDFQPSH